MWGLVRITPLKVFGNICSIEKSTYLLFFTDVSKANLTGIQTSLSSTPYFSNALCQDRNGEGRGHLLGRRAGHGRRADIPCHQAKKTELLYYATVGAGCMADKAVAPVHL